MLTDKNVIAIRILNKNGWSLRKLAVKFGVSPTTIGSVTRREAWAHIPQLPTLVSPDRIKKEVTKCP